MNAQDPPPAAGRCFWRTLERTEDFVRREPAKAFAAAMGAGLLLRLLPTRTLARPATTLVVALLPPALLGLGLIKAFELCVQLNTLRPTAQPALDSP